MLFTAGEMDAAKPTLRSNSRISLPLLDLSFFFSLAQLHFINILVNIRYKQTQISHTHLNTHAHGNGHSHAHPNTKINKYLQTNRGVGTGVSLQRFNLLKDLLSNIAILSATQKIEINHIPNTNACLHTINQYS